LRPYNQWSQKRRGSRESPSKVKNPPLFGAAPSIFWKSPPFLILKGGFPRKKNPSATATTAYNTLIHPYLLYCNIVRGCTTKNALHRLAILQKRIVRVVCFIGFHDHSIEQRTICSLHLAPFMFFYNVMIANITCEIYLTLIVSITVQLNVRGISEFLNP